MCLYRLALRKRSSLRGRAISTAILGVSKGGEHRSGLPLPDFPALRGARRGVGGAERGSEPLEELLLLTIARQGTARDVEENHLGRHGDRPGREPLEVVSRDRLEKRVLKG